MTAEAIRIRLRDGETIVMPGVFDALSARLATRAGFTLIFVSGYAASATQLAEPDCGLLTQTEVVATANRICGAVGCPVIVDADTGYGSAVNVVRTITELTRAGAAGVFLEDQVWPKRCGHMPGKRVVPVEEHVQKVRAAAACRAEHDCFIVARTDARQPNGLDDAITRALAYKEAGADALFVEAPQSVDELREIGRRLPGPLVANMVEGGVTPELSVTELAALGFQLIVRPLSGLLAATSALAEAYAALREDSRSAPIRSRMVSFEEMNEIVGAAEKVALDKRFTSGSE